MPPKEKPQFARNLTYLRNQLNLTREQAAKKAGINKSSWNSYEEGRCYPGMDKLVGICNTLQYFDIMAMITKDLANDKLIKSADHREAIEGLTKIKIFLETLNKQK